MSVSYTGDCRHHAAEVPQVVKVKVVFADCLMGEFVGWAVAELTVLNRYRVRAR